MLKGSNPPITPYSAAAYPGSDNEPVYHIPTTKRIQTSAMRQPPHRSPAPVHHPINARIRHRQSRRIMPWLPRPPKVKKSEELPPPASECKFVLAVTAVAAPTALVTPRRGIGM
ncbi:hypothetical protein BDN72DRAFT_491057 [Pluteus cervinus]|uniref:Uncharacterized protein n=1 Tax=Pluteus cervinus TaxID=181527 RepID=A0ACD3A5F4_9AGAR|nr:hypothetical protein BDN72DRAFT_491057 [Pluteus cervinus]